MSVPCAYGARAPGLAAVEASDGNPEEAARLLGRARSELEELGWSDDNSMLPIEVEAQVRYVLGDAAFDAACEKSAAESRAVQ